MRTEVVIAIVGKYVELHDSYTSVTKSLEHAAMACNRKLTILVRAQRTATRARVGVHKRAWAGCLGAWALGD